MSLQSLRSLTNKTTASVVDGCQSCFSLGLHSWAFLTCAVSFLLQSLRFLTSKATASVVDGCQSCFAFSLHSWAVLTWAVSLSLQSLRSLTGKTTDSSPSCCCGRYRSLTSKATASVVDGCQSCFAFGLHSWAVLTWAVSLLLQSLRSFTLDINTTVST